MANEPTTIVQRLWNYCNALRDDGVSCGETRAGPGIDVKATISEEQLVAQDPNDEPAPALLVRIKAERERKGS